jgi:hypothetical protein
MPLDDRLRTAFDRAATTVEPDTEMRLEQALRHGARARRETGLGGLLVAAAAVVVLVVVIRSVGPGLDEPGAPPSSPDGPASIAGTYQATLLASDPSVQVDGLSLAGTWTLTLRDTGVLEVEPPSTFEGSRAEGHTYSVEGSVLRTDLYFNDYCDSVGTYAWSLSGADLRLVVEADDCPIRQALLATRTWARAE